MCLFMATAAATAAKHDYNDWLQCQLKSGQKMKIRITNTGEKRHAKCDRMEDGAMKHTAQIESIRRYPRVSMCNICKSFFTRRTMLLVCSFGLWDSSNYFISCCRLICFISAISIAGFQNTQKKQKMRYKRERGRGAF